LNEEALEDPIFKPMSSYNSLPDFSNSSSWNNPLLDVIDALWAVGVTRVVVKGTWVASIAFTILV